MWFTAIPHYSALSYNQYPFVCSWAAFPWKQWSQCVHVRAYHLSPRLPFYQYQLSLGKRQRPQSSCLCWHVTAQCVIAQVAWPRCGSWLERCACPVRLQHLRSLPEETGLWAGGWRKEYQNCLYSEWIWVQWVPTPGLRRDFRHLVP